MGGAEKTRGKDEFWFGEFKKGDLSGFDALFEKYYQGLCVYAVKIIGSEASAKDIVQDFFARFWETRRTIEITSGVKSYFVRSIHNRCLDYISHQNIKSIHRDYIKFHFTDDDLLEYPLLDFELKDKIAQAVEALPQGVKETFKLNRFDGMNYSEIASMQEISVKTVEFRIGKALSLLRESLSDYLFVLLL